MTEPQAGDYAVIPYTPLTDGLMNAAHWLAGDCFNSWKHAVLLVDDNQIIDTVDGKAQLKPLPVEQPDWLWSAGAFQLTDTHRNKIVATAMEMVGTPHSELDFFAMAAHRLQIPDNNGEIKKYLQSFETMMLSQFIDYCYRTASVQLFHDSRALGFVSPTHLGLVAQHPENVIYGRIRSVRPPMPMP